MRNAKLLSAVVARCRAPGGSNGHPEFLAAIRIWAFRRDFHSEIRYEFPEGRSGVKKQTQSQSPPGEPHDCSPTKQ